MKAFRRMYIYKETNLPSVGWLQGCFICYAITGNCELFSRKETMRKTSRASVNRDVLLKRATPFALTFSAALKLSNQLKGAVRLPTVQQM